MADRPEEFRYATGFGVVEQSYDTWHVDIRTVGGDLILAAQVLGPRLPEVSTEERPQWVQYAFADSNRSLAFCVPVNSRLLGDRGDRRDFLLYEEVANFRITVNRSGELEIRNLDGERLLQFRIREDGGEIRSDTPNTSIAQRDDAEEIVATTTKRWRTEAGEVVELACDDIRLGEPATEQLILGNAFKAWIETQIIAIFNAHHHGGGQVPTTQMAQASAPPFTMPEALLSQVSKTK